LEHLDNCRRRRLKLYQVFCGEHGQFRLALALFVRGAGIRVTAALRRPVRDGETPSCAVTKFPKAGGALGRTTRPFNLSACAHSDCAAAIGV
jgi:hypothetical protein